ncbi:MAG: phospholipid-lipopolysaccharide transporter [Deltaproteobacteria bacterium]|nr:phospholipid-lipopolysaccharide transporter [Deltaproteobacteria bacterium]
MKTYLRLLKYLKPYIWPYFSLGLLCMIGFGATDGVLPYLIQRIMDDVFVAKDQNTLVYIPFIVVGIFAFRGLMNFGSSYLNDYVGLRIINDVRNALNRHLQSLSVSFFQRNPTGTLITRVNSDVLLLRYAITDALASVMKDVTSLMVLTVVAFAQDWVLACIAFFVFPASVLPVMRLSRKIKKFTRRGQVSTGMLTSLLQESIQGNRIVKAFGMERYEDQRFMAENWQLFKQSLRATRTKAIVAPAMELLASFGIGGVVWYGGWSVINGGRTQGEFMAFMAAMFLMYAPFKGLTRAYSSIHQGLAGAERVFETLDDIAEIHDRPNARAAAPFSKSTEFRDVSFAYAETPVLKNINLTVEAGQMVAIVGMSGVGKSTLVDLIPRFYDVNEGAILLDGVDIRDITVDSLRAQIGIVTQHTFLFNDTVRNNIAYGDPDRDMSSIIAAAKAAHAHEFIQALPHGYDSVIGEMGMQLSGGQRQRLAIARALLKNAPILILDEATSALDVESERLVQQALENLISQRTTIVIAHRLSTIRKSDRILVMVDGTIVEEGNHDELLARKNEYSRLYSMQLLEQRENSQAELVH